MDTKKSFRLLVLMGVSIYSPAKNWSFVAGYLAHWQCLELFIDVPCLRLAMFRTF